MKEILLANSTYKALVDDEKYDYLVGLGAWLLHNGYAVHKYGSAKSRKQLSMHQAVAGRVYGKEIHHINENKLDNRRENLEHLTHSQHIHLNSQSGLPIGVQPTRRGNRYYVTVWIRGKNHYVGTYDTLVEAEQAHLFAQISQQVPTK